MSRDLKLVRIQTNDEADLRLLSLANDKGKFGLSLGEIPDRQIQEAFERGIDEGWFTLADLSPLAHAPGAGLMRVFRLTGAGRDRLEVLNFQFAE